MQTFDEFDRGVVIGQGLIGRSHGGRILERLEVGRLTCVQNMRAA